jgi:hypothetical protein
MGMISNNKNVDSSNFVLERTLVNDLWVMLKGVENNGVSYRNLIFFVMAIMGIEVEVPKSSFN